MRKPTPGLWKKSEWGLTSLSTAMDLMIQVPCNGVVPRQRFGQIPQLFVGATPEQGAQTVASYWQVAQDLQQVEQHSDRHGVQHQRLQRAHHLDQYNWTKWNEPTSNARGVLQTSWENVIGGDITWVYWTREKTLGGAPPWVHVFVLDPKSWHEEGIGGNKRINKGMSRGDFSCLILTVSGWTAEGWSIPRTSHLVECCPWKSK